MTAPQDGPQIRALDAEARAEIRQIREMVERIDNSIRGTTTTPGMGERLRNAENMLTDHHGRIERHSARLLELEQAGAKRAAWTLRTLADRVIQLAAAGLVGWLASLAGQRPPHP